MNHLHRVKAKTNNMLTKKELLKTPVHLKHATFK